MSAQAVMKRRNPREMSAQKFESAIQSVVRGSESLQEVIRRIQDAFSPAPVVLAVREKGEQWEVFLKIVNFSHHTIICDR